MITYTYYLPLDHFFGHNRLTDGWSLSGTSRFASGLPVTLIDDSDNSLLGTLGNGVNNYLLDTPEYLGGSLSLNENPRNGKPIFNTSAFEVEPLGTLGDAGRRSFQGPGIENFDMQLSNTIRISEGKTLDLRTEAFNVFNHAQFYGPQAVEGVDTDPDFGHVVSAAAPRLVQLAAKFRY